MEADAVLGAARDKADQLLDDGDAAAAIVVEAERDVEDAILLADREAANQALEIERAETARILARLLPGEREQTDEHLHAERVRADGAVANRDDFLGVVAHDLRDLLGGIIMSAAVISKTVGDDEQAGRVGAEIVRIRRHAARANRLVCDLVDVASIDAGQLAIVPAPGDMALLTEVADEFRPAAAAKGIRLDVEQGGGPMLAPFDRARLFQVFGNLIANSIKFSPRDSRITLHAEPGAGELQCSVRDEGAGIPADQIELVFERFAQVEHNDRRGLGLGLFIAKRIVEAHAGRMWAQSTLGHGTSVLFTIPLG